MRTTTSTPSPRKPTTSPNFICIGDTHLGKKSAGYSLSKHIEERLYEFLYQAQGGGYDFAVHLGDVFDTPEPEVSDQLIFLDFLVAWESVCIPLYILVGNHDAFAYGKSPREHSALSLYGAYPFKNVHIIERPRLINSCLFLPHPSPSLYKTWDEYVCDVQSELDSGGYLANTDYNNELPVSMAFTHLNPMGANINGQELPYKGADFVYDWPYPAISGHIHKFQYIEQHDHLCLGSCMPLSFGEEANPSLLYSRNAYGEHLIQTQLQPRLFKTVEIPAEIQTTEDLLEYAQLKQGCTQLLTYGKIVRVIRLTEAEIDWSVFVSWLKHLGAIAVKLSPIHKKTPQRDFDEEITPTQVSNPDMLLERYITTTTQQGDKVWKEIEPLWDEIKQSV